MEWYYEENGSHSGPVSDHELRKLAAAGWIQNSTLVWREGLNSWITYEQAISFGSESLARTRAYESPKLTEPIEIPTQASASTSIPCSRCRRPSFRYHMKRHPEGLLCPECAVDNPVGEKSAVEVPEMEVDEADMGRRFGARVIDTIVSVCFAFGITVYLARFLHEPVPAFVRSKFLFFYFAVPILYETCFVGWVGNTPGKWICHLQALRSDGTEITWARAAYRSTILWLSLMSWVLFAVLAFLSDMLTGSPAFHDKLCGTTVVNARPEVQRQLRRIGGSGRRFSLSRLFAGVAMAVLVIWVCIVLSGVLSDSASGNHPSAGKVEDDSAE